MVLLMAKQTVKNTIHLHVKKGRFSRGTPLFLHRVASGAAPGAKSMTLADGEKVDKKRVIFQCWFSVVGKSLSKAHHLDMGLYIDSCGAIQLD